MSLSIGAGLGADASLDVGAGLGASVGAGVGVGVNERGHSVDIGAGITWMQLSSGLRS
jgi:hypothetical protein